MDTQQPPPWGTLIEEARKAMRPKVSMRKAAELALISEGRWRQITKGYQSAGGGQIPVPGPADTLARMAKVVGLTPDALEGVGRVDVADEMRAITGLGRTEDGDMWISDNSEELELLGDWLGGLYDEDEIEDMGPPPTKALLLWSWEQLIEGLQAKILDELKLKDFVIEALSQRPKPSQVEELQAQVVSLKERLSAASDEVQGAVAAHEEEGSIAGEQEESDTP